MTSSVGNIIIGASISGHTLTTGGNNVLLGYNINLPSDIANNQMSIGNLLFSEGIDGTGTTVSTGNLGIAIPAPAARLHIGGDTLLDDKLSFTQTDKNEYIDSEADGDLDLAATTSIDFNIGGNEDLALTANLLTFGDATDIALNATNGTKIGTATSQKIGFWNATPVVQPTALTAQDTTITHTAPGVSDFIIQDLINTTPFGFVTKDEGNTVLQVIANLQTRVSELETKLQSIGALA